MVSETIVRLGPSPARRVFSLAVLAVLGCLLIYIGLARPPAAALWQIFLIGLGALVLVLTSRMWWATAGMIELREDGLYDSDGTRICAIEDVEGVERGIFAFKPSNGFLIRLRRRYPRGWAPGMWWRLGRRVGVGGVTPGAQGRIMADMLTARIMEDGGAARD
ncbi:hypothetical protein DDZ14_15295 [Maritimibacter sp. 55A14]|uniref:hypothetical protein n=1 Tax=Maritimibacter sp. 55A14 TaxID=2174844 RepID=UPI000D6046CF|nr:hypothetical protein [Maritimibacter sp. 55A14]PWE30521.1 hypothetical protein DDZ14_15295 [Maritimibacter sp. 55A14]